MKKFLVWGLAVLLCAGVFYVANVDSKDLMKTNVSYLCELDGADSVSTGVKISIPFATYRSAGTNAATVSYDAFVFTFNLTGAQDSTAQLDSLIEGENAADSAVVKLHARVGGLSYLIDSQLIADPGTTAEDKFLWTIARDSSGAGTVIESDSTWIIRMAEYLDVTIYYMDTAGTSGNIGAWFSGTLHAIDEDGI